MWIWRRMMKVSWTEHKTNEEILQMVATERETRGQSNLTKSAHSPVRGHPRGSKVVPLNSWGRVSY